MFLDTKLSPPRTVLLLRADLSVLLSDTLVLTRVKFTHNPVGGAGGSRRFKDSSAEMTSRHQIKDSLSVRSSPRWMKNMSLVRSSRRQIKDLSTVLSSY